MQSSERNPIKKSLLYAISKASREELNKTVLETPEEEQNRLKNVIK
jgi:hypothetical protein